MSNFMSVQNKVISGQFDHFLLHPSEMSPGVSAATPLFFSGEPSEFSSSISSTVRFCLFKFFL